MQFKEAVTIVCFDRMNGLMLATHRKHSVAEWGLPGGKIDDGESPLEAVVRELGEETPYTVIIDNLEYLGVFPCYGPTNYNVHTYFVKDTSLMKLNLSLTGVEQNYAWIHPRLLTKGPFANFNSLLFSEFAEKIFGKLYNHLVWNKQHKQHIDNMSDEFPEDYEVNQLDAKQKFIEKKIAKLSKQWDWAYELIDTILADQMLFQYDWKAAVQTAHDTYGVPYKMALAIAKDKMDPDELNQL